MMVLHQQRAKRHAFLCLVFGCFSLFKRVAAHNSSASVLSTPNPVCDLCFVTTPMEWAVSKRYAEQQGCTLASIETESERRQVASQIFQLVFLNMYWVGGAISHESSQPEWTWLDGAPFSHGLWASNEPNEKSNLLCDDNAEVSHLAAGIDTQGETVLFDEDGGIPLPSIWKCCNGCPLPKAVPTEEPSQMASGSPQEDEIPLAQCDASFVINAEPRSTSNDCFATTCSTAVQSRNNPAGSDLVFNFDISNYIGGDVTVSSTARGDLNTATEFFTLRFDGASLGNIGGSGSQCTTLFDQNFTISDSLISSSSLPLNAFRINVNDESGGVSPAICNDALNTVQLHYPCAQSGPRPSPSPTTSPTPGPTPEPTPQPTPGPTSSPTLIEPVVGPTCTTAVQTRNNPFGGNLVFNFDISNYIAGDITVSSTARGDLNSFNEFFTLRFDGTSLGDIGGSGSQCTTIFDKNFTISESLISSSSLPLNAFQIHVNDESGEVSPSICNDAFNTVQLIYTCSQSGPQPTNRPTPSPTPGPTPQPAPGSCWRQLGSDIVGEQSSDDFGFSVSFDATGNTVAVGAILNDDAGTNSGHVRVYRYSSNTWVQLGSDIVGESGGDRSGYSVSLSADGTLVAIGAPENDSTGPSSGQVRVYQLSGSSWVLLADLDGGASADDAGRAVAISSDGGMLAVGAPLNDNNGSNAGAVYVIRSSAAGGGIWSWVGFFSNDQLGSSVSMSDDGTTVAMGAPLSDFNGANAGSVYIFEFNGFSWVRLGSDIHGQSSGDEFGSSVSLSSNGRIVAVGAPENDGGGKSSSGHVRVFQYNGSTWVQLGQTIQGENSFDDSGASVSLSDDGMTVAIGAPRNDGNGSSAGQVRVFKLNGSQWVQQGEDLDGESSFDDSGTSVSLSANGSRVAIGAPDADSAGHVRVYEWDCGGTSPGPTPTPGPPPSGSTCPTPGTNNAVSPGFGVRDSSAFNLWIDLDVGPANIAKYQRSHQRWTSIIKSDSSGTTSADISGFTYTKCSCGVPNELLDDMYICAKDAVLGDNILGQAAPELFWTNGLPAVGRMEFNTRFTLSEATVLHEIGHVIGIGTVWGNLVNSNSDFTGANALNVWRNQWGCSGNPPIETDGGPGTAGGHWDETCLVNELMTGFLNNAASNPLSVLTIAALQDIGYTTVDFSQADAYTPPSACCQSGGRVRHRRTRADGPRRKLSDQGYAKAVAYGQAVLRDHALPEGTPREQNGVFYVGDLYIQIYYVEDGEVFDVEVTRDGQVFDLEAMRNAP